MSNLSQSIQKLKTLQESFDSLSTSYEELAQGGGGGGGSSEEVIKAIQEAISMTDSTTAIREKISETLHTSIGYEATYDAVDRICTIVEEIYSVLSSLGWDVEGKTLSQVVDSFKAAVDYYPPITIAYQDDDGNEYYCSADDWTTYKNEHDGTTLGTPVGIAVRTPMQSFMTGVRDAGPATYGFMSISTASWGYTSATIGSLYQTIKNSLVFASAHNTITSLAHVDPDTLSDEYKTVCNTYAELEALGTYEAFRPYVVVADETASTVGRYVYFWDGESLVRERSVPLTDGYKNKGCPIAKSCWDFKGGGRQFYVPSMNHLMIIYAYKDEINKCRTALGENIIGTGYYWSDFAFLNGSVYTAHSLNMTSGADGYASYGRTWSFPTVPISNI